MSNSIRKNRYKSNGSRNVKSGISLKRSIWEYAMNIATLIFILALFTILPLGYLDHYYDIGDFKFKLFLLITSIYVIVMTVLMVPYTQYRLKSYKSTGTATSFFADSLKSLIRGLNTVDYLVILYTLVCIISFFCSEFHSYEFFVHDASLNGAWYGFKDWFMGLRSQLLFVFCYFYVSRFFIDTIIHDIFTWISIPSILVFITALLHRLYVDPLGFYDNLETIHKLLFLSTIGQSSWYSSYLMTIFPLGIGVYFFSQKRKNIILLPFLISGSMSLASQNTDTAFLSLFAVFLMLFMFAFKDNAAMKRFLELLIIFLISARLMGLLMDIFTPEELVLDASSLFILHNNLLWILICVLIAIYGFFVYNEKRPAAHSVFDVHKISFIRWIVLSLSILLVFSAVLAIIIINRNNIYIAEDVPLRNYLVFEELWGNGRGGTWMLTADMFRSFTPKNRLFGCGNDCYGYYAYKYMNSQASSLWSESFIVNAHNEWFNALICTGIVGAVTYLGIFVSAFVLFIKNHEKHVIISAAALCIVSYVSHGVFCYQTCINTPFIFTIMGMGVWYTQRRDDF